MVDAVDEGRREFLKVIGGGTAGEVAKRVVEKLGMNPSPGPDQVQNPENKESKWKKIAKVQSLTVEQYSAFVKAGMVGRLPGNEETVTRYVGSSDYYSFGEKIEDRGRFNEDNPVCNAIAEFNGLIDKQLPKGTEVTYFLYSERIQGDDGTRITGSLLSQTAVNHDTGAVTPYFLAWLKIPEGSETRVAFLKVDLPSTVPIDLQPDQIVPGSFEPYSGHN